MNNFLNFYSTHVFVQYLCKPIHILGNILYNLSDISKRILGKYEILIRKAIVVSLQTLRRSHVINALQE